MSSNVINNMPYLRTSRSFPPDMHQISIEMNKAYLDISNAVNSRTISIFPTNVPAITGESWFFNQNQRQQGLRQIYPFSSFANIPHEINLDRISNFTRTFGEYTDGTNWYGLIPGTSNSIPGQISFYIDPINIIFLVGAGAPIAPSVSGIVVLEWISNV